MTSSQHPTASVQRIHNLIAQGFNNDPTVPVILVGPARAGLDSVKLAAAEVASFGDRPFLVLPGARIEEEGLALLSLSLSDLSLAAKAADVPHGAGSPFEIQRSQSILSSLQSLSRADRGVLTIELAGNESAQDVNRALGMLLERHLGGTVDLTRTPVFWCTQDAGPLPAAYRNKCQVFTVEDLASRPTGPGGCAPSRRFGR